MIESSLNVIEPSKEMLSELYHSEEKEEEEPEEEGDENLRSDGEEEKEVPKAERRGGTLHSPIEPKYLSFVGTDSSGVAGVKGSESNEIESEIIRKRDEDAKARKKRELEESSLRSLHAADEAEEEEGEEDEEEEEGTATDAQYRKFLEEVKKGIEGAAREKSPGKAEEDE